MRCALLLIWACNSDPRGVLPGVKGRRPGKAIRSSISWVRLGRISTDADGAQDLLVNLKLKLDMRLGSSTGGSRIGVRKRERLEV